MLTSAPGLGGRQARSRGGEARLRGPDHAAAGGIVVRGAVGRRAIGQLHRQPAPPPAVARPVERP